MDLTGRVAIITGGGGMLGFQHAAAIAELGGIPVLLDIAEPGIRHNAELLRHEFGVAAVRIVCDVTRSDELVQALRRILAELDRVDILVNNAARNPQVGSAGLAEVSRLESFPWELWQLDLNVGLGGAFNCAKVFGAHMAAHGGGVIVNISSDLGVVAPDQRLYRQDGLPDHEQPVKPVTYSVVKHGLIGLTKYLATYWSEDNVRCNALSPGGVEAQQDEDFLRRINTLIPMGRMARVDEYRGAIAFLCSDASSYMNGANLVVDGGRTAW
jgi:NAD(P)-dependent dehydrogenase (short-subunit alcohol dehydrogenase family)